MNISKLIEQMGGAYVVTRPEYRTEFNKWPQPDRHVKYPVYYEGTGDEIKGRPIGCYHMARFNPDRTAAKVMSKAAAQQIATDYRGRIVKANAGEAMEYAAAYLRMNYHGHESQAIADRMQKEGREARRRLFEIQQGIQNEIDLIRAM